MLPKSLPLTALLTLAILTTSAPAASTALDPLQQSFLQPPTSARPMVRFWWFGPAVTKDGITRELTAIKAGGFGGVEVQPTYPLALDGGTGDTAVKTSNSCPPNSSTCSASPPPKPKNSTSAWTSPSAPAGPTAAPCSPPKTAQAALKPKPFPPKPVKPPSLSPT